MKTKFVRKTKRQVLERYFFLNLSVKLLFTFYITSLAAITGQCEPNQYQCDNRKCVLKSWLCDSEDDCGDGSDERLVIVIFINYSAQPFTTVLGNFPFEDDRTKVTLVSKTALMLHWWSCIVIDLIYLYNQSMVLFNFGHTYDRVK